MASLRQARGSMIAIDGVKIAAAILNCLSQKQGEAMLGALQAKDMLLAEKIQSQLFVFDDFADIDDSSMQTLITKLPHGILPLALRGITGVCLQKFLANMSARAAGLLKDELDNAPPRAISDIAKARKAVIDLARQLEAAGEIILANDGQYI
ncbi:hypothetical protein SG34_015745 [Thalassomonas viridans]|uniref:Flagellar motor switch protein FliG C-terminal domain-containing protein n=1 Tax=Thalassomonas viridans TaxID=137584 RepID=A0AAF0C727_9GAMM|nr:FliG C-terminal domain-containing protein [Thalassomonas viridans]WDE02896.1 hypothetical protein SG34_015745 [Thalassomonas viridans]